jgi:hypothetical protein
VARCASSESARAKVGEGFVDLFLSVHHEGTTEHDRLAQGPAANSRRCVAPPLALIVTSEVASSLRVSQANSPEATGRSCLPTIAEPSRTRRKAFAPASSSCSNLAPSSMRASMAATGTWFSVGDETPPERPDRRRISTPGSPSPGKVCPSEILVARGCHLLAGGQVHPKLKPVRRRARQRVFVVDDATAGRHPLGVSGVDHTGIAGAIEVLKRRPAQV